MRTTNLLREAAKKSKMGRGGEGRAIKEKELFKKFCCFLKIKAILFKTTMLPMLAKS